MQLNGWILNWRNYVVNYLIEKPILQAEWHKYANLIQGQAIRLTSYYEILLKLHNIYKVGQK